MKKYFKLLRVEHYIKNFLVFFPLFFNGTVFSKKLIDALIGFVCFCLCSSAVYIINDIFDVEKDRLHPTKKNRPIASGQISVKQATVIAVLFAILPIAVSVWKFGIISSLFLPLYLLLNVLYSFKLKHIPIVDICILVSGFFFRILYGGLIVGVEVSGWLYLTVAAVSFYFALSKRRNELNKHGDGQTREVLKLYSKSFLESNMHICMALAIAFYALWAKEHPNKYMIWTVLFVLVLSLRYSYDIENESEGNPVDVIIHDKALIALAFVFGCAMLLILYVL